MNSPDEAKEDNAMEQQKDTKNEGNDITTTTTTIAAGPRKGKRPICARCDRPIRVCICQGLPETPIALKKCHILVLQHPLESKRRNRSLPLVQLCLQASDTTVAVSRRFGDQVDSSALKMLYESPKVLLVFPAQDDAEIAEHESNQTLSLSEAREYCQSNDTNTENGKVLIVILDATWKYAKEMDKANIQTGQYPNHMKRVALSWEDPLRPSQAVVPCRFDIRTPPSQVHLSTAECIAWLLTALEEGQEGDDSIIYATLMKALDEMVNKWKECQLTATDNRSHNKKRRKSKNKLPPLPKEEQKERDYSYYGNPDHAHVVPEEEDEPPVSRSTFFTMGDNTDRGGKHNNNNNARNKRKRKN